MWYPSVLLGFAADGVKNVPAEVAVEEELAAAMLAPTAELTMSQVAKPLS